MRACRRCFGAFFLLAFTLPTCLHPGRPRMKLTIEKGETRFYMYVCNVGLCIGKTPPFLCFRRGGGNGNGSGILSFFWRQGYNEIVEPPYSYPLDQFIYISIYQ
ncbi:hypothetical protein F4775DRAFT_566909 [Biscogniauxia sp. FL1348]|nr:hypothetical protein F4775DRAFT_566909 [Biscogniauxia sp. FL1348]